MAYYQYANYLKQQNDAAFDAINHPGAETPHSGIYRCEGCGLSITSVKPHPLPAQNHHQHEPGHLAIRWRLVVMSHFP